MWTLPACRQGVVLPDPSQSALPLRLRVGLCISSCRETYDLAIRSHIGSRASSSACRGTWWIIPSGSGGNELGQVGIGESYPWFLGASPEIDVAQLPGSHEDSELLHGDLEPGSSFVGSAKPVVGN